MIKLSIIVPIYNVEQYLEECLNSIINQSIENIEVILINDGSTDLSKDIASKFVEKDKRFVLINQQNQGLSAARNTGIQMAKGKYIYFIDSDDFIIDNKNLKEMVDLLEKYNSDALVGRMVRVYDNKNKVLDSEYINLFNTDVCTKREYLKVSVNHNCAPCCMYMYKRSLLTDNNIKFKVGFLHEDEDFTPRVLLKTKKISIYNEGFYGYRQRENSITKTFSKKNIKDIISILLDLDQEYNNINEKMIRKIMKNRSVIKIKKIIYNYNYLDINKETKIMLIDSSSGLIGKLDALIIYINPKIYFYKEVLKNKISLDLKRIIKGIVI